jgi:nucleoid DNA-binding protein
MGPGESLGLFLARTGDGSNMSAAALANGICCSTFQAPISKAPIHTSQREKDMAKAPSAAPTRTASKGSAASAHKPIKDALNKTGLVSYLVDTSGVPAKDVRAVLAALEGAVAGSVHKKGAGSFTLPGLLKISAVQVPAKPKRKGVNPFTKEEQWFAAKPASTKIKVRPLKKLKDAAA